MKTFIVGLLPLTVQKTCPRLYLPMVSLASVLMIMWLKG